MQALRKDRVLGVFDSVAPDVLITELYPLGRKQFEFELIALLERSQRQSEKPITVSSIRDVLITKKKQLRHEQRVCEIINRFYDLVLIHGNERLHRLEETFSSAGQLTCPLRYTGYVVQSEGRTMGSDSVLDEALPQPTNRGERRGRQIAAVLRVPDGAEARCDSTRTPHSPLLLHLRRTAGSAEIYLAALQQLAENVARRSGSVHRRGYAGTAIPILVTSAKRASTSAAMAFNARGWVSHQHSIIRVEVAVIGSHRPGDSKRFIAYKQLNQRRMSSGA
jgi:hypothetical protein